MFWLSYECFSILCDICLLTSVISSLNSCAAGSFVSLCLVWGQAKLKLEKNFMAPFYRCGSTASRLVPLRGGSLLFTQFPEIPGTHSIDLGRMKG